jgi:glycerol-3-phosphate dehydrogenase (NAD(P)+)
MNDVAVLGAGAWGTALAALLAGEGRRTVLWARDAGRAAAIAAARENPRLPGIMLPDSLEITGTIPAAAVTLVAVPLAHLRALLARLAPQGGALVLCCKGVEAGSLLLPNEIARAVLPARAAAILSGPNFAHEIARGLPAAAVLATEDDELRSRLRDALSGARFRLYGSADPLGVALGGAAKNVIAIAAGAVMGAGLGENARAALITRGLAEIARLAAALGARAETIAGLSGLGDLLLTCTGAASRNFSLGVALGEGRSLEAILAGRSAVTEGVATAPALLARAARAGVEMPITAALACLLGGEATIAETMAALLGRSLKDE